MKNFFVSLLLCVLFATLSSCLKNYHPPKPGEEDEYTYTTKFVTGSTNNRLEILDWGGKGKPVLFLTGLGNTAHVFVDFAPRFTDKYHVYAMGRRGYGASDLTKNGYGTDTLANDILAMLKALQLDKVVLVGHSISGEEISKFASSHPDKVEKVVYIDAAYDRTVLGDFNSNVPAYPEPTTADSASFASVKAFLIRTMGIALPDEELRNTIVLGPDGKYLRHITPDTIDALILAGIQKPDYKNIKCPALAIYSLPTSITQIFPFYASLDAENKKRAGVAFTIYEQYARVQRETFKREVTKGTVIAIAEANHYVFISNPVETENYIRSFLAQ